MMAAHTVTGFSIGSQVEMEGLLTGTQFINLGALGIQLLMVEDNIQILAENLKHKGRLKWELMGQWKSLNANILPTGDLLSTDVQIN